MPTWGEILTEIGTTLAPNGRPDFDVVRRKYLRELHELTGRDTILYSSAWLSNKPETSIVLEDMQGLMSACKGLPGPELDIILHSPGGNPDATASIVRYLRGKYTDIRVFVPLAAMSAATMWALSANEIWMGKHSQLGPIDPQMGVGGDYYPARATEAGDAMELGERDLPDRERPAELPGERGRVGVLVGGRRDGVRHSILLTATRFARRKRSSSD